MSGAGISPSVTQPARSDRPDRYLSGIDACVSSAMRASYPPLVLTQRDAPQTWNPAPHKPRSGPRLIPRVRGRVFSEICLQDRAYNAASEPEGSILNAATRDIHSYMLWCWIDIRDRECFTATVASDQITHISCEALHPPVSGVATPRPRPCHRLRAFPCWVSSASTYLGSLLWRRAPEGVGPVSGGRPDLAAEWRRCA